MKKENLPSRAWKELQRGTASKESHDGCAVVVGVWGRCAARREASGR